MKKDENTDRLKCLNTKCSFNKEGYCIKLTQSQSLNNRIICEEREW